MLLESALHWYEFPKLSTKEPQLGHIAPHCHHQTLRDVTDVDVKILIDNNPIYDMTTNNNINGGDDRWQFN